MPLYMKSTLEEKPLWWLLEYLEDTENEYFIADGHLQIVLKPL